MSLSELLPIFNEVYDRTSQSLQNKISKLKLRHTNEQKSEIKSRLNSGECNGMYGKESWCKGLTKETSDIIKKASLKMSISRKKWWYSLDEYKKKEIIGKLTEYRCRKLETSIVIKIKEILEEFGIDYEKNHRKDNFVFDFYIKSRNFVIECQGDYWHSNPLFYDLDNLGETQLKNKERDGRKLKLLKSEKYNYEFFWEYDINNNLSEIRHILWQKLMN